MKIEDAKKEVGSNVFAKVDGVEKGPFYLVQIVGNAATLQGEKQIEVKVEDITKAG